VPNLVVIAGPNGAGKSTVAPRVLAAAGADFALETTLASRGFAPWIAGLRRDAGYRFHLAFLWVPAPEHSIARVARRVAAGGHAIPDDVIRRRYSRGVANLIRLYAPIADTWEVYDNSSRMRLIASRNADGVEQHVDRELWESIVGGSRAIEAERKYPPAAGVNIFGVTAEEALAAARKGVSEALARHKALGQSIAIWRDGKVVVVPPEEIEIED